MANVSNTPDESSISAFVTALNQHDRVTKVSRQAGALSVSVELSSGTTLNVRMTNIYCIGEADVRELLDSDPQLDVIVTLSSWNMVTSDAARYGRERRKGAFTWKNFFGSLNYRQYWLYEQMPYDLSPADVVAERKRRRNEWD